MTTFTATRDEVLATRTGSLAGYYVTADNGVLWQVLGPADDNRVYCASKSTGLVLLVTRPGKVNVRGKGAQVRVRLDFPRDTNDLAGTLAFDGESIGGVAPRVLFA